MSRAVRAPQGVAGRFDDTSARDGRSFVTSLELLKVFDEVTLLLIGEAKFEERVVVVHDVA